MPLRSLEGGIIMKFVTFEVETLVGAVRRIGALHRQNIIDLHAAYASYLREVRGVWRWRELAESIMPTDMLQFIEGGVMSMDAAKCAITHMEDQGNPVIGKEGERLYYEGNEVKLMAPVPRPVAIRDCSAFFQHHEGMGSRQKLPEVFYELPAHYRTSGTDVVGTEAPIIWPSYTDYLDYELEFAVCIGKYGVNISPEKAGEHIFGYTVYNDISARDIQSKEMAMGFGPAKGKCFQNSNIMGPCLVTPDEINANDLRMTARINGELWSDGNSGDMHFTFPELIAYLSKDDPVYPGEFIGSGTVGNGCGAELQRWIKPGDVIELEVEGIGILRNRVEQRDIGKR
jgi:2-keto-4-pentenoate hydratase/2-oxohepta-3-ene-1,7-dioic acid hydratase in catechol pathway